MGRGDVRAVSGLLCTGGGLEPPRPTFCPALLMDRLPGVHKRERRMQIRVEGGLGMTLQGWLSLLSFSPYPVLTGSAVCSGFGHPEGIMHSSCPGGAHAQVGEMPRKPEMRSQRMTVSAIEDMGPDVLRAAEASEETPFLPFPVSRGHPHSLAI